MKPGEITGASVAPMWNMLTRKLEEIVVGKNPLKKGAPGPTKVKPWHVNVKASAKSYEGV